MIAFCDILNYFANILAILDDGIALFKILQCNLMTYRNVMIGFYSKVTVILSDNAKEIVTGLNSFDNNNTHVVSFVMNY